MKMEALRSITIAKTETSHGSLQLVMICSRASVCAVVCYTTGGLGLVVATSQFALRVSVLSCDIVLVAAKLSGNWEQCNGTNQDLNAPNLSTQYIKKPVPALQ